MNDIFKLIEPVISLLFRGLRSQQENAFSIPEEILEQFRKILLLTARLVGSLVLFLLGMSYFIERLLDQLDSGTFYFSNSLIFLTVFMLLSILGMFYATKKSVWASVFDKSPAKDTVSNQANNHAQLETAISLFIMDVIKERELNREKNTPSKVQEQ